MEIGERGPEGFVGNLQPNAEQFALHCRNSSRGAMLARLHVLLIIALSGEIPASAFVQTIAALCQYRSVVELGVLGLDQLPQLPKTEGKKAGLLIH